jgi:septal ring factor EnvC (AmiA/AmiB activator)
MLKFTSLAIGLLTLISIVPSAQAFPILDRSNPNSAQINVNINPQVRSEDRRERDGYRYRREIEHRERKLARERAARARWEAAQYRRHGYYSQRPADGSIYQPQAIDRREERDDYYRHHDRR